MNIKIILVVLSVMLAFQAQASVLTSDQVIHLKENGAGKELITRIIESQAVLRGLISVQGVVKMKKAGISDGVITEMIKAGNPTIEEAAEQDKKDRVLKRRIQRQEQLLQLRTKRLDMLAKFLQKLIQTEQLQNLVREGKVSGEQYRKIVKYLKQYARDEPTDEVEEEGNIEVNIDK